MQFEYIAQLRVQLQYLQKRLHIHYFPQKQSSFYAKYTYVVTTIILYILFCTITLPITIPCMQL